MYVQITGGRKVKTLLPSKRKRLTVKEANLLLQKLETFAEDTGKKDTIRLTIMEDKDILFRDDCVVGEGHSRNLLLVVQHTFTTLHKRTDSVECQELLASIQQALEAPDILEGPKKRERKTKEKRSRKSSVNAPKRSFSLPTFSVRSIQGIALGVLLLVFLGIGGFWVSSFSKQDVQSKPTYEQLLKEEKYAEAAVTFPDKREDIEQYLVKKQAFQELKTFNAQFPTDEGTFDLAFYQKEWEKVIQTEGSELNTDRKVMLAYAYIQLDQLEEAEILNKTLKSNQLATELRKAWTKKAIRAIRKEAFSEAESINKRLKNEEIKELIETGKTCQEMIALYREKKDSENEKLWKQRLTQLGEELYYENE
ncbi:response regulator [Enterococcus faecalis]|nr:response regulator [Enterococcus faecalis]RXV00518.1 response regulator [Enterococcus faecalis]